MSKTVLIISSDFTGHGHKSIAEALCEQFNNISDVKTHVIDGFALAGSVGLRMGKMYGSITRTSKDMWKLVYDISYKKPEIINEFIRPTITYKFLKLLNTIKPDLIVTVHPSFNGSILNILKKHNINIPFITLIADLVSISTLWMDKRASYILCPTIESKYKCMEYGIPVEKLKVLGFPIRQRFTSHISEGANQEDYTTDKPLRCLIMSGGEGVGNMSVIAKLLLKHFNCEIKIIAGRNTALKRRLENTFIDKRDKVRVYGFVKDIQELMLDSDIAITRGSPNTMLEAVSCNVPLIITSALPGQEEGNPYYIIKYNLGVMCKSTRALKDTISDLLLSNAERLNKIKAAQRDFRNPDVAKNIVDFLLNIDTTKKVRVPKATLRSLYKRSYPYKAVKIIRIRTRSMKRRLSK